MIRHEKTISDAPVLAVTCDGCRAHSIHGAPAELPRIETILRPSGIAHFCPGCRAMGKSAVVQIPHPEHR